MDKEKLEDEIYDAIYEVASRTYAIAATNSLMKLIDQYVESETAKVRLEVMKNFKAI